MLDKLIYVGLHFPKIHHVLVKITKFPKNAGFVFIRFMFLSMLFSIRNILEVLGCVEALH